MRGIYLDGGVLDEYAQMPSKAWSEVIRPALSDRQGWAVFIGTPKGRNAFYELYAEAKKNPDCMPRSTEPPRLECCRKPNSIWRANR